VRAKNHPALFLRKVLNGGQGGPQPLIVGCYGFDALLDGYVEIDAQQDPLAVDVQACDAPFSHI
jgi:hypothetical protein